MKLVPTIFFSFLFAVLFIHPSYATHIIGGDLTVRWVSSNPSSDTYELTFRQFQDCDGSVTNQDLWFINNPTLIDVIAFDVATDQEVTAITMNLISTDTLVLGDLCYAPQGLCVLEGIYEATFDLPKNPNGYYISKEICCRNNNISNLSNPVSTGITFTVSIETTNEDFSSIGNSSPVFGEYPSDGYLCVGRESTFNYGIVDPDGDSLVYSIVTPLNANDIQGGGGGLSTSTGPAPYDFITWRNGYDLIDIFGSGSYLTIDSFTGDISAFTPNFGVFVFAVKVEEYRDGVKLGEIRRDLQYKAINCDGGNHPRLTAFDDSTLSNQDVLEDGSLFGAFMDTVKGSQFHFPVEVGQELCLTIKTLDPDETTNIQDEILQDSVAVFCHLDLFNDSLPLLSDTATFFSDSALVETSSQFCWSPTCINIREEPYTVLFYAKDKSCTGTHTTNMEVNISVFDTETELNFTLPNVFTPNDDDFNQVFTLNNRLNNCFEADFNIRIFDRWGRFVWESNDILFEWDGKNDKGKDEQEGVYYWVIKSSVDEFPDKGFVHIFR